MFKHLLSVLALALLVTACSSTDADNRDANRPANTDITEGSGLNTLDSPMPDYVEGTQEALVAHVGDRVFFAYDSAELSSNAQRTLQRQAQWMEMNPNLRVTIEGHTDERGTREYNLALGERRASAAKNYLVSLGISGDRVAIISYGKEHPVDPESSEVAWSKNRRAVTVVNQ
ncbi:MAG: peptidoglycan-associated lipoprotein Pal [Proteobacteria bacterium]|nr:peptidoglycan-associated lipoprotein Pal [Pseudomonadota bacterium]